MAGGDAPVASIFDFGTVLSAAKINRKMNMTVAITKKIAGTNDHAELEKRLDQLSNTARASFGSAANANPPAAIPRQM